MKIVKIETVMVKPRTMFLKMYTDEGIVGYGEPILEGHAHLIKAAIKVRIPTYPDTGSGIVRTVVPATSGHLIR